MTGSMRPRPGLNPECHNDALWFMGEIMFEATSLKCCVCDCWDDDRSTLLEYPLKSDEWYCPTCHQNCFKLMWNANTKRWRKMTLEEINEFSLAHRGDCRCGNTDWGCVE